MPLIPPTESADSSHGLLRELQRLPTSGARAVEPFSHAGEQYLAVPQLAMDRAEQPASMTLGNSDVDLIVYRWVAGAFAEHQRLPVPGGEDAEFFAIGERRFLATASLRAGTGPYEMQVQSTVYEWKRDRFKPFQCFDTYAAKQWTHFRIGVLHFLALAQGALLPGAQVANQRSTIFQWNGARFEWLQEIDSAWGYNWLHFELAGEHLLAYADQAKPSHLLRWNGKHFDKLQTLDGSSGRAFCFFQAAGDDWLAFACLHGDTVLYRWQEDRFVPHQTLSGPGGREFEWLPGAAHGEEDRLVQINFIAGTREAPQPSMTSLVHAWRDGGLVVVDGFDTSGSTDAAAFTVNGKRCLAVSNSLSADVRFRTETLIYEISRA